MKKTELIKALEEKNIFFEDQGYCLVKKFEVTEYLSSISEGWAIDGQVCSKEEYNNSDYGIECYIENGKYAFAKKENNFLSSHIEYDEEENLTAASYSVDWSNCAGESIADDLQCVIDLWLEN